MSTPPRPQLLRAVGLFSFTAIAVNGMVGSAGLSGYAMAGLAAALIVLCFAEVGALFDRSGGPYLYARTAFGEFVGFEIGWMLLVARLTAMAAISNAFASYLGFFWPWTAAGPGRVIVITTAIAILTVINFRGVRYGTWVNNVLTISKIVPLLVFIVAGLFFLNPNRPPAWTLPDPVGLRQASLLLIFAFGGFEFAVVPGEEVLHPRETVPVGLLTGMGFVAVLYIMIQYVAQGTFPGLASSPTPLASAGQSFLGPLGGVLLTAGAVFSTSGTNSALMLVTPRILFAMAERNQLPQVFARVHPRFRTPYVAIIVAAFLGAACALYSQFAALVAISAIARLFTYMATCVALPVFRRTMPDAERKFSVPGGPIIPIAAVALSVWMLMGSTKTQITISSAVLLAGAVVHFCYAFVRGRQVTRERLSETDQDGQ